MQTFDNLVNEFLELLPMDARVLTQPATHSQSESMAQAMRLS